MYCTLYQSCDSNKHIKPEQLRSAIKCHSMAVGVPRLGKWVTDQGHDHNVLTALFSRVTTHSWCCGQTENVQPHLMTQAHSSSQGKLSAYEKDDLWWSSVIPATKVSRYLLIYVAVWGWLEIGSNINLKHNTWLKKNFGKQVQVVSSHMPYVMEVEHVCLQFRYLRRQWLQCKSEN